MKQFEYTITESVGIHARPASMLVKAASAYQSNIMIEKNGSTCEVKRLIALMSLGIKCGEKVTFSITGPDEDVAAEELEKFCKNTL